MQHGGSGSRLLICPSQAGNQAYLPPIVSSTWWYYKHSPYAKIPPSHVEPASPEI